MKNKIRFYLLHLIVLAIIPINAFSAAVIRGNILNVQEAKLHYQYIEAFTLMPTYQKIDLIDNQFELRLDILDPIVLELYFDAEILKFYVLPDDNIEFSFNVEDEKSLIINSSHTDDQKYLCKLAQIEGLMMKAMSAYAVPGQSFVSFPDGLFEEIEEKMKEQKELFLKDTSLKMSFSESFKLNYLDSTYAAAMRNMTTYLLQNSRMSDDMFLVNNQISREDVLRSFESINIEDARFLHSRNYTEFIYLYDVFMYDDFMKNVSPEIKNSNWNIYRDSFRSMIYSHPETIYIAEISTFAKNNHADPDKYLNGYKQIIKKYPQGKYNGRIEKHASSLITLKKGESAPAFTLEDIDGNTVSLKDLRGKILYVEFWATWCLPCVYEMKKVKEIKPMYEGKDILFVYITKEGNKEAWKEGVKNQDIEGIHLFGGDNSVIDLYNADGVPKFILIDKEGKIISSNAPRPSDKETLTKILDAALQ